MHSVLAVLLSLLLSVSADWIPADSSGRLVVIEFDAFDTDPNGANVTCNNGQCHPVYVPLSAACRIGLESAIDLVNESPEEWLGNSSLHLERRAYPTGGNTHNAVDLAVDILSEVFHPTNKLPVFFLQGPMVTASTVAAAPIFAIGGIPQVSAFTGSSVPAKKRDLYPLYISGRPNEIHAAQPIADLLVRFGYKRFGILRSDDTYGAEFASLLTDALLEVPEDQRPEAVTDVGFGLVTDPTSDAWKAEASKLEKWLAAAVAEHVRIFVVHCAPPMHEMPYQVMRSLGMLDDVVEGRQKYLIIGTMDFAAVSDVYGSDLPNTISLASPILPSLMNQTYLDHMNRFGHHQGVVFPKLGVIDSLEDQTSEALALITASCHDSVLLYSRALQRVAAAPNSLPPSAPRDEKMREFGKSLQDAVVEESQTFSGLNTIPWHLDGEKGIQRTSFLLQRFDVGEGEWKIFGAYGEIADALNAKDGLSIETTVTGQHLAMMDSQIVDMSTLPRDYPEHIIINAEVSQNVRNAVFVLGGLGCALAFGALVWLNHPKIRALRYIRMSSPNISSLQLLAIIAGFVYMFVLHQLPTESMCTLRAWWFTLTFVVMFGALFSKLLRVHRIFSSVFDKVVITDWELARVILALAGGFAVVLGIFTGVGAYSQVHTETQGPEYNPVTDKMVTTVYHTCGATSDDNDGSAGLASLAVINIMYALLLMGGVWLALSLSGVQVPALNDSQSVGFTIYWTSIVMLLTQPVVLLFGREELDARYFVEALQAFLLHLTALMLLFAPRIYNVATEKHLSLTAASNYSTGGGSRGGGAATGTSTLGKSSTGTSRTGTSTATGTSTTHSSTTHSSTHSSASSEGDNEVEMSQQPAIAGEV